MSKKLLTLLLLLVSLTAAFSQQYDLRLNLKVGQKVGIRLTVNEETDTNIPNLGPFKLTTSSTSEYVFTVKEKKGENYVVEGVIPKNNGSVEMSGLKKIEISSEDPEENMYNKELKSLVRKRFKAEITPKFRLVGEVQPVDKGVTPEKAKLIFMGFENFYRLLYPEKSVAVNDTWEENISFEALNLPNIPIKNKLTAVTNERYIMEGTTTVELEEDGVELKGTATFKNEIQRKTGIPIRGEMTMPMEGKLLLDEGGATIKAFNTSHFEYIK